jgi:energy-coupling factor transporter ATP-binding protein EcfA2
MYVSRMRLFGVGPLYTDLPVGGGTFPDVTRRRLLLHGANGSGKTTVLDSIRTLWQFFGEWLERGPGQRIPAKQAKHWLARAQCAAVELTGFPSPDVRLWIGMAGAKAWAELQRANPGAAFAGAVRHGATAAEMLIELPAADWRELRARSMVGVTPLPNVVHIPPDNRTLRPTKAQPGSPLLDLTPRNWCTVFDPGRSLDKLLLTIKALREEDFNTTMRLVSMALSHRSKRLGGFNEEGRLEVLGVTDFGPPFMHPVEHLSSGERQMLLLTAYAAVLLRPGGILLIDEPDLHIHRAMLAQLLETIEHVTRERKAQLIVASHSEVVWDWFARPEEQLDLSPVHGGNP